MLHAELGRHPIQINIKSRMIGFWLSIVNGKESKLSKLLYSIMLKEHVQLNIEQLHEGLDGGSGIYYSLKI